MTARREQLWTIEDLSDFLQKPVKTLYDWRHKKYGPPAYLVGGSLRYSPKKVQEWLDSTMGQEG
ncbi:helix-turn-helix domain-containing protein [Saccharopolyspora indica]|uniref:helix-turn-helix transcriptional regulator n=1 Tax=Saccharopolyspora indica TaxID=1229659 RepID=UPI0022EB2FE9|nr:helix-turn-helix domain-containing protein [Saccharopolyspora indica]MDA3647214.1 helix-turn-helix domain-containing protein [Saccharopolyspora indica]